MKSRDDPSIWIPDPEKDQMDLVKDFIEGDFIGEEIEEEYGEDAWAI